MRHAMLSIATASPILPSGYRQLQYIQSTGIQRIDTGVRITPDLRWYLKTQWLDGGSVDAYGCEPWGLNINGNVIRIARRISYGIDILYGNYKAGERGEYFSYQTPTTVQEFYIENGAQYLNGDLVMSQTMTNSEPNYTIQYFCTRESGRYTYYCQSNRHYRSTMWYGADMIRDFVPALRVLDGKPGLFDVVNETFYINVGSGEFLYG